MDNFYQTIVIVFNILGGLVIFLYAMRLLGRGLQNIIGEKIEILLRKLTDRPHKGMVVGALVTFFTQSSSITVLTLIGLVNAGVLNLRQGIGIILGSEIGTTITAQLIACDISFFFLPILVFGFVLSNFFRSKKINGWGKVIFSFGLLFTGMELMKTGASPLRESPFASTLFKQFGQTPLLGIIAGTLFTGITSSSSATTSLVVALGASGTIGLPAAIAIILGANIGTCILELLAVIGMSLTAKRVAVAQVIINVIGVIFIFPFIGPFAQIMSTTSDSLARQIANSHTVFNIASSLFFLGLIGLIVTLVKKIVPGKTIKLQRGTKYIDKNILNMPHIALVNATKEVKRTGDIVLTTLDHIKKALFNNQNNLIEYIYRSEDQIDFLEKEIVHYLTAISEQELDSRSSERLAQLFHGIHDIERASDHANRIGEQIKIKIKGRLVFSKTAAEEMKQYLKSCRDLYQKAVKSFILTKPDLAQEVNDDLQKIRAKQKELRSKFDHWDKPKKEIYFQILQPPPSRINFHDMIVFNFHFHLRRIGFLQKNKVRIIIAFFFHLNHRQAIIFS